jgi:hypothetical protein
VCVHASKGRITELRQQSSAWDNQFGPTKNSHSHTVAVNK